MLFFGAAVTTVMLAVESIGGTEGAGVGEITGGDGRVNIGRRLVIILILVVIVAMIVTMATSSNSMLLFFYYI